MQMTFVQTLRAGTSVLLILAGAIVAAAPSVVTLDENGVLVVNGKKQFVISFSIPPPANGKTPEGRDGWAELKDAGTNFFRIAPRKDEPQGSPAAVKRLQDWLDAAASHDMHCWITLGDLPALKPDDAAKEKQLRDMVNRFKDHPGLGAWKAFDEAAWVKRPADQLRRAYSVFHETDPYHPVVLIQAPTKASLPLEPYWDTYDITGVDIYPIAYPPGKHSDFGNREISVVADCTQWVTKAARGKPVWMTLQVAWGGVASPGKILRFPTFAQQRYMAYAAIINGARGLNYQGPALPSTLNETDAPLEWNWTYWKRVMKQLVEELGYKSPVNAALIAPNSKIPLRVEGATDVEFCAREVGNDLFVLAAKREGQTGEVRFSGLPDTETTGTVLFEEPRKVSAQAGSFTDWFGPNEVHVYKWKRK
jgi:hypothetical protein